MAWLHKSIEKVLWRRLTSRGKLKLFTNFTHSECPENIELTLKVLRVHNEKFNDTRFIRKKIDDKLFSTFHICQLLASM